MTPEQFQLLRGIVEQNASDGKMLKKLAAYRQENSLDMDEAEQEWYDYVTVEPPGAVVTGSGNEGGLGSENLVEGDGESG